jgi:N-acetylneuraminic acid mutarotase
MKQGLLLAFFALSLLITSCGSSDDNDGNWIKRADYKGAARGGAVSFTIGEDVYLGLGYAKGEYFSSFYKYNSTNNGWTLETPFPAEATLRREAVAFSINGKGYVGLGVDEFNVRLNDFWEFDPVAKTWTKLEGEKEFPGSKRQGAVAFAFDDVVYVGTGNGFLDGEDRNDLADFYEFDGSTWTENETYGGSKTSDATTFVIGTKAYLVSGNNNLDNVWEFNSETKAWKQMKDIDRDEHSEDVQRVHAVSFVIDGLGYISTGVNGLGSEREVWEYNPTKDDWREKTELEAPEMMSRINAIGFNVGNRGFMVTGSVGSNATGLSDMWEFEPNVKEDDDDND